MEHSMRSPNMIYPGVKVCLGEQYSRGPAIQGREFLSRPPIKATGVHRTRSLHVKTRKLQSFEMNIDRVNGMSGFSLAATDRQGCGSWTMHHVRQQMCARPALGFSCLVAAAIFLAISHQTPGPPSFLPSLRAAPCYVLDCLHIAIALTRVGCE